MTSDEPGTASAPLILRVLRRDQNSWLLECEGQPIHAELAGNFRHNIRYPSEMPVVGDWVSGIKLFNGLRDIVRIQGVETRRNAFQRKAPISGGRRISGSGITGGRTESQVMAANIDTAFIVIGADRDANPRRLERYLLMLRESRIPTVVLLNKIDLQPDGGLVVAATLQAVIPANPDHPVPLLLPWMGPDRSLVFVGSSGAGKTSLLAALGARTGATGAVSGHNAKGMHTTTTRESFRLPDGSLVIDTPGIRELQLWAEDEDVNELFADLLEIATACHYPACRHELEKDCAVQAAIAAGSFDPGRLEAWRKLKRETGRLQERQRDVVDRRPKARHRNVPRWSASVDNDRKERQREEREDRE